MTMKRLFVRHARPLIISVMTIGIMGIVPMVASAHEVYVLEQETIDEALASTSPNPLLLIFTDSAQFFLWAFIALATVVTIFLVSVSRRIEKIFDPILFRIKKPYAILIGRVTLGAALIASGYYGALFGPDLPLTDFFSATLIPYLQAALLVVGALLIVGLGNRFVALFTLGLFAVALVHKGVYMLTYVNYLGEMILVLFLGAHVFSLDKKILPLHQKINRLERFFEKYAFLILRILFGTSLIYASVYAKLLHSNLALHTVIDYDLTAFFHFPPLFIVLGAALIEIALGIFFIIGFEIRFAALFLSFFLTLSLLYFGEAVWPHIILYGVAFTLFTHGYDRYTLEGRFLKDARHEPVL